MIARHNPVSIPIEIAPTTATASSELWFSMAVPPRETHSREYPHRDRANDSECQFRALVQHGSTSARDHRDRANDSERQFRALVQHGSTSASHHIATTIPAPTIRPDRLATSSTGF